MLSKAEKKITNQILDDLQLLAKGKQTPASTARLDALRKEGALWGKYKRYESVYITEPGGSAHVMRVIYRIVDGVLEWRIYQFH